MPKGSLCNLKASVDVGLPPDAVYNIVTDPDNKRVFKNIKVSGTFSRTIVVLKFSIMIQLTIQGNGIPSFNYSSSLRSF